jgi:hypothetical protein
MWHDYRNPEYPELTHYLDGLATEQNIFHIEDTRTHLINIIGGEICETGVAQGVSADWDGGPLGTD